jgi:hypothetical protein
VTRVAAASMRSDAFSLFVANCCLLGAAFCQTPQCAVAAFAAGTGSALRGLI